MLNRVVETPLPALGLDPAQAKDHRTGTIFPSLSRAAAAYTSDPIHNYEHCGARLFINVTDVGAAGTLTVKIQVMDPATGTWADLATSAALAAAALTILTVYPGITAAANVDVSTHLGLQWRVVATVAANAVVFSVGAVHLG